MKDCEIDMAKMGAVDIYDDIPVADPGFPVGGGRQPPMRTLFSENVCENERN